MVDKVLVQITVNNTLYSKEVEPRMTLVDFIRDEIHLTGTHVGCEHGVCGACSVLLNDDPIRSCCMFAVQADGMQVTTVEGLAPARGQLSNIQDSFCECHAMQCGYCTPGMLVACHDLVKNNPHPTEEEIREAISGNLCRCTGYQQIVDAVLHATGKERSHD
ncbi:4-hydroxybenzoyl-CoA reductase subunit gamma [Polynucleobacter sp. QLW-P1DATA-2]|jgi:carbon-monoxide dehydrogenase small subunit|uniref:(2Fe-2S)-binding protein n=1 Tax=unclassified Polynucleobacter TaxID=2640945 RepID=UPI0008F93990|nr:MULTISPECIES: (2Fe-2S)-binding protein [unclassified Polynucleobacter]OIM98140.1 4-hydroxybenzoyl-CoA reductase subunit gamma [Polynucleobacter sp. MWH-Tro8-2-5-gr]OIM98156.1 4-hydroxybenzoyl-CoA reductase subunit gamma [Polynucleobacter sp. QLW-P1DATA-2]